MRPKWLKLASLAQKTLSVILCMLITFSRTYLTSLQLELLKDKWLKQTNQAWKFSTLYTFSYLSYSLLSRDNLLKNLFDFTTAGDRDCVAAVERLSVLHFSVDFIFLSFGIMVSIVEHDMKSN